MGDRLRYEASQLQVDSVYPPWNGKISFSFGTGWRCGDG